MSTNITITPDLIKYRTIILSLTPYSEHPKLDYLIEQLTNGQKPFVDKAKQFLIKMEIKRLAAPCSRIMDFRMLLSGCEEVIHDQITHFLDEISKSKFLQEVDKHGGKYNFSIYHSVSHDAKVRHLEAQANQKTAKRLTIDIDSIGSLSLVNRNINHDELEVYSSSLKLFNYDPLGMSRKGKLEIGVDAELVELSKESIIFKMNSTQELNTYDENKLYIWLYDHHQSLDVTNDIVLNCAVADQKKSKNGKFTYYYIGVEGGSDKESLSHFNELLLNKLKAEKSQQANHIEPLIDSITAKVHEQFFLSTTVELPLLLSQHKSGYRPIVGLQNPGNLALWQFFNESNQEQLSRLFANPDLQAKITKGQAFETYVHILKQETEKGIEFGAVWNEQLENSDAKKLQLNMLKGNFKKLKFNVLPVNAIESAYSPAGVPSYVNTAIEVMNLPIPKPALDKLTISNVLVIVTDVTDMVNVIKGGQVKESDTIKIGLPYRLPVWEERSQMEIVRAEVNDLRYEDRFSKHLKIKITSISGRKSMIYGLTKNISSRGLNVSVTDDINLKVGEQIKLSITLPYKGKLVTLDAQPYQVINGDNNKDIRMMISGIEKKHMACAVLKEFIYKNLDTLVAAGLQEHETFGMQKALRTIYAKYHISIPFFIHHDKRQYYINTAATNELTNIKGFGDNQHDRKVALLQMLQQDKFRSLSLELLNQCDKNTPTTSIYLLVLPRNKESGQEQQFWFRDVEKLSKSDLLDNFMETIQAIGQPSIFKLTLSKTGRVMDKYFRDELSYLEHISGVNAEEITRQINLVTGVGELTEHTEEVLSLLKANNNKKVAALTPSDLTLSY